MLKTTLVALGLMLSLSANAHNFGSLSYEISQAVLADAQMQGPFHFVVGDQANYNLTMGGFIPGNMSMTVKAVDTDTVTIAQDMTLMGQTQSCVEILNPNTGEVKKFTCNGQDQDAGSADDVEVIETKEDTVKVPAGSFTCLYIKAHQKSSNQDVEQWINPKEIPVFGLAKTIAPSQLGQVVIELASFKKN